MTRKLRRWAVVLAMMSATSVVGGGAATAQEYQTISGEGSSWSFNAIDTMRVNVVQYGITVNYNPTGSTSGRKNYLDGLVDFAASDIPFQFEPEDGSEPDDPEEGSYAYIPVTAGGTAFMYNLKINGQRVSNLRLSGENIAKIFTGVITQWNDPAIQADNPGLVMPALAVNPVVRSDGSGSTAQFTTWMIARHKALWDDYCQRSGRAPNCGFTSFYPTISGMTGQNSDIGVAGYIKQDFSEGAIGYVNYSYALADGFPVVKVLNAAGYYTEPTPENVAVSLLQARINEDESDLANYLTQDLSNVYSNNDPRNYELSSYSYFILPTVLRGSLNETKGRTLADFAYYAMCQAQQSSASLGYSPIPINLVEASFTQIRRIPGANAPDVTITNCNNPTFSTSGENLLAQNAPQPQECDRQGDYQCPDGTAGMAGIPTSVSNPQPQDTGQQPGGSTTGGSTTGGSTTGGSTTGGSTTGGSTTGGSTTGGSTTGGSTTGGSTTGGSTTGGSTTGGSTTGGSTSGGSTTGGSTSGGSTSGGSTTGGSTSGGSTTGGSTTGGSGDATFLDGSAAGDDAAANGAPVADPSAVDPSAVDPSAANPGAANPSAAGSPQQAAPAVPNVLDDTGGFGQNVLMLLIILGLVALILGPALAWRVLAQEPLG